MIEQMREEFVVGFEGAESLLGMDCRDQGPQQGRLTCALIARDDDGFPRHHRRLQEPREALRKHAVLGKVGQRHIRQEVLSDHDARPERETESDGVQPEPVAEGQRHGGVQVIERPRWGSRLAQESDRIDELLVAVGHGWMGLASTVGILDHHAVVAVDLDVLGRRNLEEGLQSAVSEDGALHRVGVAGFQLDRPERCAGLAERQRLGMDDRSDDGPTARPSVLFRHHLSAGAEPLG